MKAYLFDSNSGLYEGETYEEPAMIVHEDGLTTVSPPDCEHGEVPVFDRERQSWVVIPVAIARQLLKTTTDTTTEKPL